MYIDAFRRRDTVYVSVREGTGERKELRFPAPYYLYHAPLDGEDTKYTSMYGEPLVKKTFKKNKNFLNYIEECKENDVRLYESDVRPEYKVLENHYRNRPVPKLNIAILDIESDKDEDKPYSRIDSPYATITGITIYRKWEDKSYTIVLCPPTLTLEEASAKVSDIEHTTVVATEEELLEFTMSLLVDADVISGWNSNWYDLPMLIQRIRIKLGNENYNDVCNLYEYEPSEKSKQWLSIFCLFGEIPRPVQKERWKTNEWVFNFSGKVALDYLEIYRKYTFEELHSYSLDAVLEKELGDEEKKIAYEGTLSSLWREDFALFTKYNRQDVVGLAKVDKKIKFIDLANEMAHMACVKLSDTLGSVTIVEQAVLCELHEQGLIAADKIIDEEKEKAAGAFVHTPIGGLYKWISSFDINSLYPSVIRMLNISPETFIGQFDISRTNNHVKSFVENSRTKVTYTDAWQPFEGVFEYHEIIDRTDVELILEFSDGTKIKKKGYEWADWLKENNLSITANGTVFDLSKEGILPFCLTKWYNERVEYKALSKKYNKEGDIVKAEYWDNIQMVRKIFLNSLYGALLNVYFRFGDSRFGQSTTLSGRVVTKHMIKKSNELIEGKYEFGKSIVYSDTDSVTGDSVIETNLGDMSIEELYNICGESFVFGNSGSERNKNSKKIQIKKYDTLKDQWYWGEFDHVYRHKVKKSQWKITDSLGNSVKVTGDHSIMVEREGNLLEITAKDLKIGDVLVTLHK